MKLSLVVLNAGKASGQTIPIRVPQFVIGRDPDCNLRPGSAMISKKHCALYVKEGTAYLRDYGSTNGTFLNDQPVKGEVALANDDVVKVGPLQFKIALEVPQPAAVSRPTPPPPSRLGAKSGSDDDDAAAMLLGIEDGGTSATTETSEAEIPGGSTVMDMPAINPEAPPTEGEMGIRPAAKKPAEKPKHESAQSAAQALLDKLRKGQRGK